LIAGDQEMAAAPGIAVDAVRSRFAPVPLPIAAVGPVHELVFPVANVARDIPHGLGVVPDGYFIILQSGGVVQAVNVVNWTTQTAWLQANTNNTRLRVLFYRLQEGVITYVVPS